MKVFTNQKIWKKLAIALVIVMLFQFIVAKPVRADDGGFGGKLLVPIMDLVVALGDGVVNILHDSIMEQSQTMLRVDVAQSFWDKWGGLIVGIVVGLLCIVATILTCGLFAMAAAAVGITTTVTIGIGTVLVSAGVGTIAGVWYDNECLPDDLYLPLYSISAEEIFQGKISLFDIDFFNPREDIYLLTSSKDKDGKEIEPEEIKVSENTQEQIDKIIKEKGVSYYYYYEKDDNGEYKKDDNGNYVKVNDGSGTYAQVRTSKQNTSLELQKIVSKWYNSLRNISIVLMMSILLYIGIRMLLSTVASDKSKYKQMLMDWLVGMCLLFFMHYIMAFAVTLSKQFVKVLNVLGEYKSYSTVLQNDESEKLSKALEKMGYGDLIQDGQDGNKYICWPTNLMGKIRVQAEMETGDEKFIGYSICFFVLVLFTIFFAFTYLKRVIYMAFLTMIAPLVALTYPIDKITDGQAQAFNKWLKEYIFNLLIQPLHLLLYTILVTSAYEFASVSIWYMLVAIGFMIPAEKLLRSFFGFEKASTPGSFAGAAVGAGLLANGMGSLLKGLPKGGKKQEGSGKGGQSQEGDNAKNPIFANKNFDSTEALMGDEENSNLQLNDGDNQEDREAAALERYKQDGFGQNAFGEYFDPSIDDYNPDYDPRTDKNYLNTGDNDGQIDANSEESSIGNSTNNGENSIGNGKVGLGRRMIKGAKGGGRALGVVGRRFTSKSNLKKLAKFATRTAVGATVGATAGMIGVAAGIASGDPSKAFQLGTSLGGAGMVAGTKLTDATMNKVGDIKNSETVNEMKKAYYGSEEAYKQAQKEKQTQKILKDKEFRRQLEYSMGKDTVKQMYESEQINHMLDNGITDAKDIKNINTLMNMDPKDGGAKNLDQAIAVHKYSQMVGDTTKMKAKDKKDWKESISERFQSSGHSKEKADKGSENTMRMLDKYNQIRFKE